MGSPPPWVAIAFWVVLLLTAITLAACGESGGGLCDRLPGTSFVSEELISVIFDGDEIVPGPEFIDFNADEVDWLCQGDVIESGEWRCSSDRVSFLDRFDADVIDEGGQLVLDRDGTRYLQS